MGLKKGRNVKIAGKREYKEAGSDQRPKGFTFNVTTKLDKIAIKNDFRATLYIRTQKKLMVW